MKDYEAMTIAKLFRNAQIPFEEKSRLINDLANQMIEWNQFFDKKRFINVALQKLDE